jgi:hypothetical protein
MKVPLTSFSASVSSLPYFSFLRAKGKTDGGDSLLEND